MRSLAQLLLTVLLNASWQIAVVTVFAACCSWLLRGTAAWCRHTVWVTALVISLCLPIISGMNALESSPVPKQPEQNLTRIEPEPSVTRTASLQEIALTDPTIVPVQLAMADPDRQGGWCSPISLSRNLAVVLVAFYAFFLLYRSYKLLRAWQRTRAIIRSAWSTQVPARAGAIISKCQTAIGVKRVGVVCSMSVPLPITAGVFNPLIILPEQLLSEADEEVLLSAIGHELVHVARRDYLLNLVYELIYLPVSFHPAAAVLRRRIKQTRELCCDELVAKKLLTPEVYARSLVRLVGSVPLARRLSPDTTIGITDADILEVRIMTLLRRPKLSAPHRALLLIAASLLLITPCVAAASFALRFDIKGVVPGIGTDQERTQEINETLQRAREEVNRKEQELKERVRNNPNLQGTEREAVQRLERELQESATKLHQEEAQQSREDGERIRQIQEALAKIESQHPGDEAQVREAQQKIAEMEKLLTKERMREVKEAIAQMEKNRPENEARLRDAQAALEQMEKNRPENEARLREARAQLEQMQKSFPWNEERSRELREQLAMIEKQHLDMNLKAGQWQSLRHAQEEIAQQQKALTQEQREKIEEKLKLSRKQLKDREQQYREAREKWEAEGREGKTKIKSKEYEKLIRRDIDMQVRKKLEEAGRVSSSKEQAELAQLATMSMDRALQIALSQHPGKVLSCNLGRQKDGQVFYRLVIINGEGGKNSATHVWINATDGRILKTERE